MQLLRFIHGELAHLWCKPEAIEIDTLFHAFGVNFHQKRAKGVEPSTFTLAIRC